MSSAETILLDMKNALISGNLNELSEMQSDLDSLVGLLSDTDPSELPRIQALAQQTAKLLQSAQLGIREARSLYEDIQHPGSRIVVYRADGQRRDLLIGGRTTIRA